MVKLNQENRLPSKARYAIYLTYAGLWLQAVVHAFWIALVALCVFGSLYILHIHFPQNMIASQYLLTGAVSVIAALVAYGVIIFKRPNKAHAAQIVDNTLPNHPIRALQEQSYIWADGTRYDNLVFRHRHEMAKIACQAKWQRPDLSMSTYDPYGLHFSAILMFAVCVIFGVILPGSDSLVRIGNEQGGTNIHTSHPTWEGWIIPPAYSLQPNLYLNDLLERDTLTVLKDSEIQIQLYRNIDAANIKQTISPKINGKDDVDGLYSLTVNTAGHLSILQDNAKSWDIDILSDTPPSVKIMGDFNTDFFGETTLEFQASDDYGIVSGRLRVNLDINEINRVYGLTAAPRSLAPLEYDIILPPSGDLRDFLQKFTENFSKSVWAHLPVQVDLELSDYLKNIGNSEPLNTILPSRRFFDPLAAALIEMRRDLLWSDENAQSISQKLRALRHKPSGLFHKQTDYLRLRIIINNLERAIDYDQLDHHRTSIAKALWEMALTIEEGDLDDAREQMMRAKERLSQAMKNGASPQEIARLMQELKRANDNYLRQLRQEANRNTDQNDDQMGETINLSQNDIQKMMDRIQELMEQGRMAEAQQALTELQKLMESLQMTQGEGGQSGPTDQAMRGLEEALRDQQELSDEAFHDLQKNTDDQQENSDPNGTRTPSDPRTQNLADRQRELRDHLDDTRRLLPNLDNDLGRNAQRNLDEADKAMRDAENALKDQDLGRAIDRQADAMEAMREGMRNIGRALDNQLTGEAAQENTNQQNATQSGEDILGREGGVFGDGESQKNSLGEQGVYQKAKDLLNEIERRSSQRDRPKFELEYLNRLLERF